MVEESRRLIETSRTLIDLGTCQIAQSEEVIADSRRLLARADRCVRPPSRAGQALTRKQAHPATPARLLSSLNVPAGETAAGRASDALGW
jgi:hypothetical protein